MPPTETKFRLSRIVVSAVVFISLCVSSEAESRRCYWCGPLAEQVHRSQRAPPCSAPHTEVTDCDPGFPYCAVVATAPPYMESRYCVKLYQDECYSLYCNSTRTWRMTCPCRGDLCNGPNTERELDAFAGLAKLVARTQNKRNRRALKKTADFISMMNTNRNNRIDNTTVEEHQNIENNVTDNTKADENNEVEVKVDENPTNDDIESTAEADIKDVDNHIDTTAASEPPDVKSEETQVIETTTLANVENKNNEATTNSPITDEVIKTNDGHMNETSIQIDIPSVGIESRDLKTDILIMSSETSKLLNDAKVPDMSSTNVNIPEVPTTAEVVTQVAMESKTMAETTTEVTKAAPIEVKMNENKPKSSELAAPTVGPQQHEATIVKTTPNLMVTTTVKPRNNTAVQIEAHILTLAIGVVLNYV